MLTPEQKKVRAIGIGSSEIAALVGKDPHATRQDIFNSKVFGSERKRNDSMGYGSHAEAGIVAYHAEQLGARIWTLDDYRKRFGKYLLVAEERHGKPTTVVQHPERPLALCSIDAVAEIEAEDPLIVEAKNAAFDQSADWGEEDDDVPEHYWLQTQWLMGTSGIHRGDLVAAIGGRPPLRWSIRFLPDVFENLYAIVEAFWRDHVLTKIPPGPIDGSDAATEYLRKAYPREEISDLGKATPDLETHAVAYDWLGQQITKLTEDRETEANACKAILGPRLGARLSDGRRVTWKHQTNGSKPPTRVLRVSKGK